MQVTVSPPSVQELTATVEDAKLALEGIHIDSAVMYEAAGEELRAIVTKKKALEEKRMTITRPLDDAKKAVMDLFRGPIAALEAVEGGIKSKMLTYRREQEAKAAEERRRAEEEAAKLRRLAEAAAQTDDTEKAVELTLAAEVTAAVTTFVPRAAGVSSRKQWVAEVTDLAAFLSCVATHPQYHSLVSIEVGKLNALARAQDGRLEIDGVRTEQRESMSARRA